MVSPAAVRRVGSVWDDFTRHHHWFHGKGLEVLRRLFVSADVLAEQQPGSTSWTNKARVDALWDLPTAVFDYTVPNGEKIEPQDVMVISTYGNQATVARPKLKSVCFRNGTTDICENPTMDASQAGEAPFVFLMMTKPPAGPYDVEIAADKSWPYCRNQPRSGSACRFQ
ncbi:hypothetical protein BDW68DRAFT_132426 [Aspergillus falconensis]